MTKIIPLGDRVLVKLDKTEVVTSSGIIIPDTASKDRPTQGIIDAIGNDVTTVNVGDSVLFSQYGPEKVQIGDDQYYILKEEVILAIIK